MVSAAPRMARNPGHAGAMLVASALVLSLQACSATGYDNKERIVQTVLYGDKGRLDERAFGGALLEKFASANSPVMALTKFVESLGRQCSIVTKHTYPVELPDSSQDA